PRDVSFSMPFLRARSPPMRPLPSKAVFLSVAALFAAAIHAQPLQTQDVVLVDQKGMTVYTFDQDKANSGKSVCNDDCAKNWPPVMAGAHAKAAAHHTLIHRDDGSTQSAHKRHPLYTFVKDKKPGDRTRDNLKSLWHIVNP